MTSQAAAVLDFQMYLRLTEKQHLVVEIHEIGRIHCEVVSI